MAKFVKGNQLNAEIESLFDDAESQLTIISPYIKLHKSFIDSLKPKLTNPNLEVILVFGKNEANKSRSLSQEDFEFFSQFANVKIYYEPRLHAKYYANQNKAILSSMNLYDYSQNHNIEFGIVTYREFGLEKLKEKVMGVELDQEAWEYFNKNVVDNSTIKYHKKAVYESNMLGLSKKYVRSEVKLDLLTEELSKPKRMKSDSKSSYNVHTNKAVIKTQTGIGEAYCIRSGESITFDIQKPYSEKAFKSWNYFKNKDFPEKYCHYSGDSSDGKTSMSNPILSKNWSKAKKDFNLK